jgi:hypothetical protein
MRTPDLDIRLEPKPSREAPFELSALGLGRLYTPCARAVTTASISYSLRSTASTNHPSVPKRLFGSRDLDILELFREVTSQTIGDDSSASVYQREVVQLATNVSLLSTLTYSYRYRLDPATQHVYLMHAILASTSLHMRALGARAFPISSNYEEVHTQQALALFRQIISTSISEADADALLATATSQSQQGRFRDLFIHEDTGSERLTPRSRNSKITKKVRRDEHIERFMHNLTELCGISRNEIYFGKAETKQHGNPYAAQLCILEPLLQETPTTTYLFGYLSFMRYMNQPYLELL